MRSGCETGQDPVVFDHLADAEYRLGDHAAARQHWQRALGLLDERAAAELSALHADLIRTLRGKLEALEASEPVSVAPTAAQQREEKP